MPPKSGRFPDTRWSLVGRAAAEDDATRQEALAELLRAYEPGLKSFLVHGRRLHAEWADDILQSFIADKILARKLVHHANQGRGRFRNLVLKALNNFVATCLEKERRNRLEAGQLDEEITAALAAEPDPDQFDREWVQQVVRDALQLMEQDCRTRGRADLWEVFRVRIADPMLHGVEPVTYEQVVEQMGIETPRQAINLLVTAKRSFMRNLRTAVGRYVEDEEQIEREIVELRDIIGR